MIFIKTEEEIKMLREGGRRLAAVIQEVAALARPGATTKELDDLARKLIEEGGDRPSFLNYSPDGARRPYPASSCISINEEVIHGIPNEHPKTLKEGDIVGVDVGLCHKDLYTDSAVTVAVGYVDDVAKKLIQTAENALTAGIASARVGNYIGDVSVAIEAAITNGGFSVAKDLCGHGVGRKVHEDPFVPNEGVRGEGPKLRPGMVIAIEPMVNEGTGEVILAKDGYTYRTRDGKRSAHFEHTVAIFPWGPEVLTVL